MDVVFGLCPLCTSRFVPKSARFEGEGKKGNKRWGGNLEEWSLLFSGHLIGLEWLHWSLIKLKCLCGIKWWITQNNEVRNWKSPQNIKGCAEAFLVPGGAWGGGSVHPAGWIPASSLSPFSQWQRWQPVPHPCPTQELQGEHGVMDEIPGVAHPNQAGFKSTYCGHSWFYIPSALQK